MHRRCSPIRRPLGCCTCGPAAHWRCVLRAATKSFRRSAIAQLVARRLFLGAADNGTLRALGMSRSQLLATEIAQVSATATLGGLLALLVAVLASPTMPIGPARVAEPHPGVALDWPVLGS